MKYVFLITVLLLLQHYYMKNEVLGLPPPLEFEEPQGASPDMSGMYSAPLLTCLGVRCKQTASQPLTVPVTYLASDFICIIFMGQVCLHHISLLCLF